MIVIWVFFLVFFFSDCVLKLQYATLIYPHQIEINLLLEKSRNLEYLHFSHIRCFYCFEFSFSIYHKPQKILFGFILAFNISFLLLSPTSSLEQFFFYLKNILKYPLMQDFSLGTSLGWQVHCCPCCLIFSQHIKDIILLLLASIVTAEKSANLAFYKVIVCFFFDYF